MPKQEVYIPNMKPEAKERSLAIIRNMPNRVQMSYSDWGKLEDVLTTMLTEWAQADYRAGAIAELE